LRVKEAFKALRHTAQTIRMAPSMTHYSDARRPYPTARQGKHSPLHAPILWLIAATIVAIVYVAYVLWPRWPGVPVSLDAPALPIMVAGTMFNVEPAAIRVAMQRKAGTQDRLDISYLWPSLAPPDPAVKPTVGAPFDPNERLFATISSGEATLPIEERVKTIYPRYFAAQAEPGPDGLMVRAFRDGTPYQGEDLIYDAAQSEAFLARCTRRGIGNAGTCLMERRIKNADVVLRFPRDWLNDWRAVAKGVDRLLSRLHPAAD